MLLKKAGISELHLIRELAERIWPENYSEILTEDQISYMMEMMYSQEKLERQWNEGIGFYLIRQEGKNIGYLATELNYPSHAEYYIHKIYLLPELQGKGLGRKVMTKIFEMAAEEGMRSVVLNVNRYNKARFFYEKMGFEIAGEVDIDIGKGFLMEDYVMQKNLISSFAGPERNRDRSK